MLIDFMYILDTYKGNVYANTRKIELMNEINLPLVLNRNAKDSREFNKGNSL